MQKTPTLIIVIRYILVLGLIYAIWTGCAWAVKLTCTLCILHSEMLYITNRVKEIQVAKMMVNRKMESDIGHGTKD